MLSYFIMSLWHLKTDMSTVHSLLQFLGDYLQLCIQLSKRYMCNQ